MQSFARGGASAEMNYTVKLDTIGKYIDVELQCSTKRNMSSLMLKMPVWAPGYYMIQDFPKHLCDFAVHDTKGNSLRWQKKGKNGWQIDLAKDHKAVVTYRIFADQRDVASSRIDNKTAFIAPNGVFMYVEGEIDHPVTVNYVVPTNWKSVSCGLLPTKEGEYTYTAPNFDILYDSPLLMGNHLVRRFNHEGRNYEFALETPDGYEQSGFEESFRSIVSAATQMMQDVPYQNYTLIHMGKGNGGLEHLNSQACYTDGSFRFANRGEWLSYLAFTAHEYFHLYNVKTIRPIELGPFDYDREVCTPLLWFSEGITCYYEAQLLYRAGLCTKQEMLDIISNYLRMDEPHDGHHHQSLRQSSYDIWLNFLSEDANTRDVTINYYFRGPVVGLIMDLEIQRLSDHQRSLDDLMRLLYKRYHKQLNRGFTEEEFWKAVDEVAGTSMAHIRHIVDNPVDIDYERFLSPANLTIDRKTWTIREAADPNFHIYLCFGQSNMEGAARIEHQDSVGIDPRFQMLSALDMPSRSREKGKWYTAYPPLCREYTGLTPADYFGREMVAHLPKDIKVGVVHVAVGGANINLFNEDSCATDIAKSADWYKRICKEYDNNPYRHLITLAKEAQKTGVIKGILLHQGCTNNGQQDWPERVKLVYERMLAELNLKAEDCPLLVGELMTKEEGGCCYHHNAIIDRIQETIPTAHPVSSAGCPGVSDHLHFTAEGYRILGRRYAEVMLKLLNAK